MSKNVSEGASLEENGVCLRCKESFNLWKPCFAWRVFCPFYEVGCLRDSVDFVTPMVLDDGCLCVGQVTLIESYIVSKFYSCLLLRVVRFDGVN